jgi:pimeloyl-ACP methyl ester carboxylesterase
VFLYDSKLLRNKNNLEANMKTFEHQLGQYLDIGSARIYFEMTGEENKPVLLVLHGGFGTMEDLDEILGGWTDRFCILGIDSRGHGKSTMGRELLTYAQMQRDVEMILKHLHIDQLSILGFSDGGIVAYRLACFSNLKIDKIVTIGSRWHWKNADATRHILQAVTAESWRNKFPDTFEMYQRQNPERDFDRLAKSLVALWMDSAETGYPNENLQKINFPLLMIRGDKDPLTSVESLSELQKLIKDSSFFNVPGAGHAPFATQGEMIKICLREFFGS